MVAKEAVAEEAEESSTRSADGCWGEFIFGSNDDYDEGVSKGGDKGGGETDFGLDCFGIRGRER